MSDGIHHVWRLCALNAGMKFCIFGLILLAGSYLSPDVVLPITAVLATDAVLTIVGTIGDVTIVPRFGNIPSLSMGAFGIAAILLAVPRIIGGYIPFTWCVTLTICIGPFEYLLHKWILKSLGGLR